MKRDFPWLGNIPLSLLESSTKSSKRENHKRETSGGNPHSQLIQFEVKARKKVLQLRKRR